MRRVWAARPAVAALAACASIAIASIACAQDIEPRVYSNAPVGVNFLIVGYAHTQGGLPSDPSLPVTNVNLTTSDAILAYVRALDIGGKSGKVDVVLPYTWLSGSADFANQTLSRVVNGFANPLFRLSINLYGAPALRLKEFASYKQNWIVGTSLLASLPLGQYDSSRVVNIGANRWAIRPEVGVSKATGRWTLEIAAGATFFSVNKDFFGGDARTQAVLYSSQGHAIYSFSRNIWASVDATYYTGGRSTLGGVPSNDLQRNWRAGATFAFPIYARNSIKLSASRGVSARTGNNFDLIGLAWQYRWGGGL